MWYTLFRHPNKFDLQGRWKTNFRLLSFLNRSSDSGQIYASNSWLYCLQVCKFGGNSLEKKLFVMAFKRDSVLALYLARKPQAAIVGTLQCINVNTSFVSHSIARYSGSVALRLESGRKNTASHISRNVSKSKEATWSNSALQWPKNG